MADWSKRMVSSIASVLALCIMAHASNEAFYTYPSPTNLVSGAGKKPDPSWAIFFPGVFENMSACESACMADAACNGFTFHDGTTGIWANKCVGTTVTTFKPSAEAGHFSGCAIGVGNCDVQPPPPVNPEFDCGIRSLAMKYAMKLLPSNLVHTVSAIQDGLELTALNCTIPENTGVLSRTPLAVTDIPQRHVGSRGVVNAAQTVFNVDPIKGDDSNSGSSNYPLQSVYEALSRSRKLSKGIPKTVMLKGINYFNTTMVLTAEDSGTTITSTEGAVVSGGVLLQNLQWSSVQGFPAGVKVATLSEADASKLPVGGMTQLFVSNNRAVRARHPNANYGAYFRTGLFDTNSTGYFPSAVSWTRSPDHTTSRIVTKENIRNTTRYSEYTIGFDGPVKQFNPPAAYWAVNNPPAGGGCKYEVPVAVTYAQDSFPVPPSKWTASSSAIVHAFHRSHWGDWEFQVTEVDADKSTIHFGRGGFQEARGSCGKGGHEWYIEGIKELLDQPNEWFYDENTRELFYFFNETETDSEATFVASSIATLFSVNGTGEAPADGITISNLTFMHTKTTFMDDYEVPSGGDWSIHRGGTIFVTGSTSFTLDSCQFIQIGGNGICISAYNRDAHVLRNEFDRIGDSAVLVVGATNYFTADPWVHTDGNYPINTYVASNVAHEVGVFTKQTAFFFQALGWNSTVIGNIAFNGPRSGVNINDAAFGGNIVKNNLLFNLVRETIDHGPFNTWDRLPFVTPAVNPSKPSADAIMSHVDSNFFICNYGAVKGIDHDDGSGWYNDRNNYMVYCSGKMKGETQSLSGNIYLYPTWLRNCVHIMGGMSDVPFIFENNTCVNEYGSIYSTCPTPSTCKLANNKFYVAGETNPNDVKGFTCSHGNWSMWSQSGQDTGSSMSGNIPSVETMVGWGAALLGI